MLLRSQRESPLLQHPIDALRGYPPLFTAHAIELFRIESDNLQESGKGASFGQGPTNGRLR